MPASWECCVLSSRGLCDEPIPRPEESYRLFCVVCDLETSMMRQSWSALGCCSREEEEEEEKERRKKKKNYLLGPRRKTTNS